MTDRKEPLTYILLKIEPKTKPVYFIIESQVYDHSKGNDGIVGHWERDAHLSYFYEEHTCPTNFIPINGIQFEGDSDPHGVFTYCGEVLQPEADFDAETRGKIIDFAKYFPEINEDEGELVKVSELVKRNQIDIS